MSVPFGAAGVPSQLARQVVHEHALAIVDTLRQAFLVLAPDQRVVGANRSFYESFRTTPEATLGRPLHEIGEGEWSAPALRRLLEEALPEQAGFEGFEVDHAFPSLGRRVMLLDARRLPAGGGEVLILLAISDVTALKLAEERLAHHARQLERSNRELEEFAQVASHDLQEPLRKVQAFANLLAREQGDDLKPAARGYLDSMLNAAGRMRALINALLSLARLTTRAQPFVAVDLSAVLAEVLADLGDAIGGSGARVEVGALPVVHGDPSQLRQALENLVGNALKFCHAGTPPVIRVQAAPAEPGWTAVTVSDEGIGFDEKYLDRIFLPFERLHSRGGYPGTGIGLAIVRKVVERHGGSLTARSAPGEGATFIATLPLETATGEGADVEKP